MNKTTSWDEPVKPTKQSDFLTYVKVAAKIVEGLVGIAASEEFKLVKKIGEGLMSLIPKEFINKFAVGRFVNRFNEVGLGNDVDAFLINPIEKIKRVIDESPIKIKQQNKNNPLPAIDKSNWILDREQEDEPISDKPIRHQKHDDLMKKILIEYPEDEKKGNSSKDEPPKSSKTSDGIVRIKDEWISKQDKELEDKAKQINKPITYIPKDMTDEEFMDFVEEENAANENNQDEKKKESSPNPSDPPPSRNLREVDFDNKKKSMQPDDDDNEEIKPKKKKFNPVKVSIDHPHETQNRAVSGIHKAHDISFQIREAKQDLDELNETAKRQFIDDVQPVFNEHHRLLFDGVDKSIFNDLSFDTLERKNKLQPDALDLFFTQYSYYGSPYDPNLGVNYRIHDEDLRDQLNIQPQVDINDLDYNPSPYQRMQIHDQSDLNLVEQETPQNYLRQPTYSESSKSSKSSVSQKGDTFTKKLKPSDVIQYERGQLHESDLENTQRNTIQQDPSLVIQRLNIKNEAITSNNLVRMADIQPEKKQPQTKLIHSESSKNIEHHLKQLPNNNELAYLEWRDVGQR